MKHTSELIEIFNALKELVELKTLKEKIGETPEYQRRKPVAWITAKRIVQKYKDNTWGVVA